MEYAKSSSRVCLMPVTCIVLDGLDVFSPRGNATTNGCPGSFVRRASLLPSRKTLTSRMCTMNVIEEARKRVRSNAIGMGAGSRRGISNDVHSLSSEFNEGGKVPRLANS